MKRAVSMLTLYLLLVSVAAHAAEPEPAAVLAPDTASQPNAASQAEALNAQGKAAYADARYADAILLFQKAVAIDPKQALYVINLSTSLNHTGQYESAQKLLLGAMESFPSLDDQNQLQIALADCHFFWGRALAKQADYAGAAAHDRSAAAIDRVRRPKDAGYDLDSLGDMLRHLDRNAEALAAYRESLTFRRALTGGDRDVSDEASSLGGILLSSLALKHYEAAAAAYDDLRLLKPGAEAGYETAMMNAMAAARDQGGRGGAAKARAEALNTLGLADYNAKRYDNAIPRFRKAMELQPFEASYALNLARSLNLAKRYDEASVLVESKLAAFPEASERKKFLIEWADAQFGLGEREDGRQRWPDAARRYRAAYGVDRVVRGVNAFLDIYRVGVDARNQRRFAEARTSFQQAAAMAMEIEQPKDEALALLELAGTFSDQQQYALAIQTYQKPLEICRAQKMHLQEARILQDMGDCGDALSRYPEALEWRRQALAAFEASGDRSDIARILNNLGISCDNLGRFEEAHDFYARALALHRAAHDVPETATTLNNLGTTLFRQGRYLDALELFHQALALRGPDGKSLELPESLSKMGLTYSHMGRYQDAVRLSRRALAIFRRRSDRAGEAEELNNLGVGYYSLGEYDRTAEFFKQSLALRRALGGREGEATELNNLGQLYDTLGQPIQAGDDYGRALAIYRAIGDRSGEANTLNNQSAIFMAAGALDPEYYKRAATQYERVLALDREIGDANSEGVALNNLGSVSFLRGRLDEAQKFFDQALQSRRRTGDRDGESVTLNNLGKLAMEAGHLSQAREYFGSSLLISADTNNQESLQITWTAMMTLASKTNDAAWGIFCGKQSVNILQRLRGQLKSFDKGVQKRYLELNAPIYRALAEMLIKQGRLSEAQQVLAMLKQEEFFDFLGRDPGAARMLTGAATLTPFEARWRSRFERTTDRAPVLRDMEQAFQNVAATHADVRSHETLAVGTAAVYTIVEPEKLYLIVTTSDGRQIARESPIASADLYRKVLALRNALQDPTRDPRPLAQELYKIILGPIEADLKAEHATTLLWSLDDALRYLPISALYDGKQYMVERYDNCVLTLAGPARAAQTASASWTGLGLGVSRKHPGFDALPGVRDELAGIIGPVVPGQTLLDARFTQAAFLARLKRRDHPLVHIASHFSLSGRDTDSFLLLGDGAHLTMAQMKTDPNVFAGVDLLTLSACNTAMEVRGAGGKEVEGFGALAQRLGARSVLASLWPVADASTPMLMREFYRLRRAHPALSKASDLRQAQLELLRGLVSASAAPSKTNRAQRAKIAGTTNTELPPFIQVPRAPYSHPFYWAPFVLIGNPK